MFTIIFDQLFDSRQKLFVIIELQNKFIRNEKIKNIEFNDIEKKLLCENYDKTNKSWTHFAQEEYELTEENILHLSQFLSEKINESPILSIYQKLNTI